MPPILERCVQKVKDQGHPEQNAYAICRASLGLQEGDDGGDMEMPDAELDEKIRCAEQVIKAAAIPERKDVNPESGVHEYGKVPFADPVNKKYPIDTEEHIRAAWNYIHKAQNASQYDAEAVSAIKDRIAAAWRKVIDKAGPPALQATDASPVVRKWIPISMAVGKYVNGDQTGTLSQDRLKHLIANFNKYPRQVPIYLLPGKPDPDHPDDLDKWLADGWIEGLRLDGGVLMGDANLHGAAAAAVNSDSVRGASIGTIQGSAYDGSEIGEVLEHVVLTNQPFVKGLNIAASLAKGGERVASYFTALPKEAKMADKKKPDPAASADDGGVNFKERAEALEAIVREKDDTIVELTASRDNLLKEVEQFKANPQLAEAVTRMKGMERQLRAEKVRRLVNALCADGQVVRETVKWAFADSDETVLAGFETGDFKGKIELLEFARKTFPKQRTRNFVSGGDAGDVSEMTAEESEAAKKAGKDPKTLSKKTLTMSEWKELKERRKAAGKE